MKHEIGIVGAGFAGAVLAHELAATGLYKITVIDERAHVAGNCHTSRDEKTGVMLHHYGPHIFNTDREDVWAYVQRYGRFGAYTNRVKAVTERGMFSLPINLLTINQFFGKTMTPAQAKVFVEGLGDASIEDPKTFEEQALRFLGNDFYRNFFYGYTKKQWGVEPSQLPASILKRLPVRFNYDDNYYKSKYQGIPVDGYSAIVDKLLAHPAITVRLGETFARRDCGNFSHVFYSGPMDVFFSCDIGRLNYRSLRFERFDPDTEDYQGNAVINYCQEQVPWTRIAEHKHFAPWEQHERTVCFKEFSKLAEEGDVPYYPLALAPDLELLRRYKERARQEPNVTFIGRLGTYRYLDMHVVIGESLDLAKVCLQQERERWPRFSNELAENSVPTSR